MPRHTYGRHNATICGGALLAALVLGGVLGQSDEIPFGYKGREEHLPRHVAPQPIPFDHRAHVESGLACKGCHSGADKGERAGFPEVQKCMLCHSSIKAESPSVQKLAEMAREGREPDWVRVYQLPDFVFFSHANHLAAEITCDKCHGPVEKREVLSQERSTSMEGCMNCHLAEKTSTDCHLCHELGE